MWRIKRVKATGENSGEAASADESDDALQVTIEKSKKVLAMQQDLLQQVTLLVLNHKVKRKISFSRSER